MACRGVSAGNDRARRLRAGGAAGERQQRDVAGALDGFTEPTLMSRANASHASRQNLAALLHELRQDVGALVVDKIHLLNAELADLLLAKVLALTAARPSRTSWTPTRSAFATWTAVSTTGAAMSAAGAMSAFTARRAAGALCLLLFLCHTCLPFGIASIHLNFQPPKRFHLPQQRPLQPAANGNHEISQRRSARTPQPVPRQRVREYGADGAQRALHACAGASSGA